MQKYRNQFIIGILITIAIYIVYLFVADNSLGTKDANLSQVLAEFDWRIVPLLIGTQLLMVVFRFISWQYYLGIIGARNKISLFDSFVLFVSSFVLVISPGKAAEVLKSVLLKSKTGVPFAKSVPIVFAERIIDGLAVIVLMSGAIFLAGNQLNLGEYETFSRVVTFSSLAVIVGGLIVVQIQPLAYFCLEIMGKLPLVRRIHQPLVTFYESSREIFQLRHVIPMTIVGVGTYFASAVCFILVLWGFGFELTSTLCLQATFIVGITSAIGALSFVPNGAGVTEISNTAMLVAIVAPLNPAMTSLVAASASLIQGFFHKWFRVLLGLGIAIIFRKRLFSENLEEAFAELEQQSQVSTPTQSSS